MDNYCLLKVLVHIDVPISVSIACAAHPLPLQMGCPKQGRDAGLSCKDNVSATVGNEVQCRRHFCSTPPAL